MLCEGDSLDDALAKALAHTVSYAEKLNAKALELAQAYGPLAPVLTPGAELFSLIRESKLCEREYINRYFDTGGEIQSGE